MASSFLNQFKTFLENKNIKLDAQDGFQRLKGCVSRMDLRTINQAIPQVQAFLAELQLAAASDAQRSAFEKLTALLNASMEGNEQDKKEALKTVFSNALFQQILINQLCAHQKNSGLSDEAVQALPKEEKLSFAAKALAKFSKNLNDNLDAVIGRNIYEPVGLLFNTLFEAIFMAFECMLHKHGIDLVDVEENSTNPTKGLQDMIMPEMNPAHRDYIPVPSAPRR